MGNYRDEASLPGYACAEGKLGKIARGVIPVNVTLVYLVRPGRARTRAGRRRVGGDQRFGLSAAPLRNLGPL